VSRSMKFQTRPGPHLAPRTVWRTVVLVALATGLPACSNGNRSALPDGPNWSLADKSTPAPGSPPRSALGASATTTAPTASQTNTDYAYRGGRDPVTGQASTQLGQPQSPALPNAQKTSKSSFQDRETNSPRTIAVQSGDTLHKLSLQHHVSIQALMSANKLTSSTIRPGQKLIIPAS
jgi:LysM repeat protein